MPPLADWLLAHVERGTFTDPSEAVFVMLGEQRALEPHADVRREFLKRRIQASIDSGPGTSGVEVFTRLRKSLAEPGAGGLAKEAMTAELILPPFP